jgi:hypothetical protein
MTREEPWRPPRRASSPEKFQQSDHEKGLAQGHERGRDHITRPMGAQVDSRITDRRRDEKIEPAPPAEKECANGGDDHVVRHVS